VLEVSVLRHGVRFALTGLLFACSLPFFAISLLIAALSTAGAAVLHLIRRRRASGYELQRLWAGNEFAFEHGIEAYEELIDAQVRRRP
jgi:hypothetical protein